MPTSLRKPLVRIAAGELDGSFGADRGRRLVIRLVPGTASSGDVIEFRPEGTRRWERVTVADAYRYAIRSRVNLTVLEKARNRKAAKAARREREKIARADRKIRREAKEQGNL